MSGVCKRLNTVTSQIPAPTPQPPVPFDIDWATLIARIYAARVVGRSYARHEDREDLVQELMLQAHRQWHRFDSARGSAALFLSQVMRNKAISVARKQGAIKRGPGRCQNLGDADGQGVAKPDDMALRLDVADVISTLPAPWRELCELMKSGSPSAAARALGVPRHEVVRWISRIRAEFELKFCNP